MYVYYYLSLSIYTYIYIYIHYYTIYYTCIMQPTWLPLQGLLLSAWKKLPLLGYGQCMDYVCVCISLSLSLSLSLNYMCVYIYIYIYIHKRERERERERENYELCINNSYRGKRLPTRNQHPRSHRGFSVAFPDGFSVAMFNGISRCSRTVSFGRSCRSLATVSFLYYYHYYYIYYIIINILFYIYY